MTLIIWLNGIGTGMLIALISHHWLPCSRSPDTSTEVQK